ncbi:hypothetical protein N431DRAFT_441124 [Stipitochalara longipes BDJ]|nr:hypothetical protein N431DRAFT_441124 [Stipitochalara longipes BDJ]
MENGKYVPGSEYFYLPSKVAPAVFAFLFGVSLIAHVWQCMCWKVTMFMVWANVLFIAAYIVREVGAFHIENLGLYVAGFVLVNAAPPFYQITNYLILGRSLYSVPQHATIHPGRISTTYSVVSGLIEVLNIVGAEYSKNTKIAPRLQSLGKILIKISLVLQLLVLVSFVLLTGSFHRHCAIARNLPATLKPVLLTLYCSSFLIGIRTVYRTVEYFTVLNIRIQPSFKINDISPILRYEWYFWVFEATVMLMNSLLLNLNHPMQHLPRDIKTQLSVDGTEVEGVGYEDNRSTWQTFVDPFNLAARKERTSN